MAMNKNWQKLSEEVAYNGYRKIIKTKFQLPNGMEADFDIISDNPVVCVFAITPSREVVLAKQFRAGPNKVLLELPGGGLMKNEAPLEAIQREFLEETGYKGDFKELGTSYHDGYSTRVRYHFAATGCEKVQDPQKSDEEFTEAVILPLDLFIHQLHQGELTDSETAYRALEYLGLLK